MGKRGGRRTRKPQDERGLIGDLTPSTGSMTDWATVKVPRKKKPPPATLPDPVEAVTRGAAWMDSVAPLTLRRMDPDTVDIQSILFCPLSNAFPDDQGRPRFPIGVRMLCHPRRVQVKESSLATGDGNLDAHGKPARRGRSSLHFKGSTTETLSHYGFAPHPLQTHPDPYLILNVLWSIEIRKRQNQPVETP